MKIVVEKKTERAQKLRLESLSDLIFGLALSIGSLVLIARIPQTPSELVIDIVQFGFSFLILVIVWSIYNSLADLLPAKRVSYFLNFALLFLVSIEPFLYYVLVLGTNFEDFATSIYAVDIGLMYFIIAGMTSLAIDYIGKIEVHEEELRRFKRRRISQLVSGAIFLFFALPFFWIPAFSFGYLRIDLWIISFFAVSAFRISRR